MGRIVSLIRYRFFLFAGILPYLLGTSIAYRVTQTFQAHNFWIGLLGLFFVFVGVETFNEYFDYKYGGDRIFSEKDIHIPGYVFWLGLSAFAIAFAIGIYLAFHGFEKIILLALLGFLAAAFYVGPPIRWVYRGWGEIVIAISYGPLLVFGSYYLQRGQMDYAPVIGSLFCGLLIFSLSLINEIPDFFQDRLVGKNNLVVRLGKRRAIRLFGVSLISTFVVVVLAVIFKELPALSLVVLLVLPFVLKGLKTAQRYFDQPQQFTSAIRMAILSYVFMISILGISYIVG